MLVEGAGSASEVNLRADDIANMGFARAADVPVVLVGDIDRGGVIASLVGTKAVIDAADAAMIVGFIVNRFRGDPTLFDDGMKTVERAHRLAALGLVPFFEAAHRLPAEDAVGPAGPEARRAATAAFASPCSPIRASPTSTTSIRCGSSPASISSSCGPASRCPATPRWSSCRARRRPSPISPSLRDAGWDIDLQAHLRRGGHVLGICGGYQMLGRTIADPHGIEGPPPKVDGLGLLDVDTVLEGDKVLVEVSGETADGAVPFKGYEMHVGRTTGSAAAAAQPRRRQDRRRGRAATAGSPAATSTACWPTTGSGSTGCSVSADARRASTTKPMSTRRSTCWPTISRSTSIATGCSRWRATPHAQASRAEHDQDASTAICKPQAVR